MAEAGGLDLSALERHFCRTLVFSVKGRGKTHFNPLKSDFARKCGDGVTLWVNNPQRLAQGVYNAEPCGGPSLCAASPFAKRKKTSFLSLL